MATHSFLICDVFAEERFEGNQLAVLPDASGVPEADMQRVAREFNFSETVLCFPADSSDADHRVRIFTPTAELPFAGHPVLGTAALLAAGRAEVRLATGAGVIPVRVTSETPWRWSASMSQPLPTISATPHVADLLRALGVEASELPVETYDLGIRHTFVKLPDEPAVSAVVPDFRALERAVGPVGVSCFAGEGTSWRSRMFGPGLGVNEDPATGSAAGPLAAHLCRHGLVEWGQEIAITQGVELGRPSRLLARAEGSAAAINSVWVTGTVIRWAKGEMEL